jgi:hypothetical protein
MYIRIDDDQEVAGWIRVREHQTVSHIDKRRPSVVTLSAGLIPWPQELAKRPYPKPDKLNSRRLISFV